MLNMIKMVTKIMESKTRLDKNGCDFGIYCFKCSGNSLERDGTDKGNMLLMKGQTFKRWKKYKCIVCSYECAYDKGYVERNAIR